MAKGQGDHAYVSVYTTFTTSIRPHFVRFCVLVCFDPDLRRAGLSLGLVGLLALSPGCQVWDWALSPQPKAGTGLGLKVEEEIQ